MKPVMTTDLRARCLCTLLVVALLPALPASAASDSPASAEAPDSQGTRASEVGAATLDVVLLRPIGCIATAFGFGFFVVSSPFVAPSRDFSTSWDIFVQGPGDYTFQRPIGVF
jgi:hypothetical protein